MSALANLDPLWPPIIGVIVGGLLALAGTYLAHSLTEQRERRNKRDELRFQLYSQVVEMVCDNQLEIARSTAEGSLATPELQSRRISIAHRLKLLGSLPVYNAYNAYRLLVDQATDRPIIFRPDHDEVDV